MYYEIIQILLWLLLNDDRINIFICKFLLNFIKAVRKKRVINLIIG